MLRKNYSTKNFEEWMSSVGSRITEKLAEVTVN